MRIVSGTHIVPTLFITLTTRSTLRPKTVVSQDTPSNQDKQIQGFYTSKSQNRAGKKSALALPNHQMWGCLRQTVGPCFITHPVLCVQQMPQNLNSKQIKYCHTKITYAHSPSPSAHHCSSSPSLHPSACISPADGSGRLPSHWDSVSHRGLIRLPVSCPLLLLSYISTKSLNYLTGQSCALEFKSVCLIIAAF